MPDQKFWLTILREGLFRTRCWLVRLSIRRAMVTYQAYQDVLPRGAQSNVFRPTSSSWHLLLSLVQAKYVKQGGFGQYDCGGCSPRPTTDVVAANSSAPFVLSTLDTCNGETQKDASQHDPKVQPAHLCSAQSRKDSSSMLLILITV